MMSNTQVLCLIILLLDFRSLAQRQGVNPTNFPDCQCAFLFNRAGQGNCNRAGAKSHSKDQWCYIAENVNGRKVEAQAACPDSVRSSVHTGRFWSNVACETPTTATSSSPITYREPLEAGESLRKGHCEYTCGDTGGCTTELVVNLSEVREQTETNREWSALTKTECASSYNNGICGTKISGCNDCNKVIDCKGTTFPHNGVELLDGTKCSASLYDKEDRHNLFDDDDEDEDGQYFDLDCYDTCIETNQEVSCACGKMIYKEGRPVPGNELAAYGILCYHCPGCPDYPDCSDPDLPEEVYLKACVAFSANAINLVEGSALAGTSIFQRLISSLIYRTEKETCGPTQCRLIGVYENGRNGRCCDTIVRANGRVLCPIFC